MGKSSDLLEVFDEASRAIRLLLKSGRELMPIGLALKASGKFERFEVSGLAPMLAQFEIHKLLQDAVTQESCVAVALCMPLSAQTDADGKMQIFDVHAESATAVSSAAMAFRRRPLLGWREEHNLPFPHAEPRFYVS